MQNEYGRAGIGETVEVKQNFIFALLTMGWLWHHVQANKTLFPVLTLRHLNEIKTKAHTHIRTYYIYKTHLEAQTPIPNYHQNGVENYNKSGIIRVEVKNKSYLANINVYVRRHRSLSQNLRYFPIDIVTKCFGKPHTQVVGATIYVDFLAMFTVQGVVQRCKEKLQV